MNYFDEVRNIIDRYKIVGEQILEDGTILIGKVPHIAPHAWLHNIYPVLSNEEVQLIEEQTGLTIPGSYGYFLTNYSNGLKIFSGAISLDGLRKKLGRSIENAWQPYSIFTPNNIERIKDAKPSHFFIGGYNWNNGSLIYIDNQTGKVHRCSKNSIKPLNTWDNFESMLVSETNRLALLFDEKGIKKDKDNPTIPHNKSASN